MFVFVQVELGVATGGGWERHPRLNKQRGPDNKCNSIDSPVNCVAWSCLGLAAVLVLVREGAATVLHAIPTEDSYL